MTESKLLMALETEQKLTLTENGASAYSTSGDALLDLFALAGSLRSRLYAVDGKYALALTEDKLLAAKLAFYTRDARGGLGEREAGRRMFAVMAEMEPEIMRKNLALIPYFGRWDDVTALLDTPVHGDVIALIRDQLSRDMEAVKNGEPVSLLAKWLPSVNTSSRKARLSGARIAKELGMSERNYRKTLSALRSALNVTEVRMTAKDYDSIRYESVPSYAMKNYRKAFARNDADRFNAYMESVEKGDAVIRSAVLYPYDITEKYMNFSGWNMRMRETDRVLEAQWKALPDYVEGENNFLVMVDVSGSMYGRPMATSVGLGIYFAERNKGAYAGTFMTFTNQPRLVKISGETLRDKIASVLAAGVGYNTNLELAFDTVLNTAVRYNMPQSEMPKSIIVISDGEIDRLTRQTRWGFVDEMKNRFEKAGYTMPNLVLWNVASRHDVFHASKDAVGVQMCSGQSASVFMSLIRNVGTDPYEYMVRVLNDERYDAVTV